ncbi:TPA: copper homeostasis protein CutC [Streptococcus suis]|nr:copper homeostasis protein CutC [Streptococcus suis]
MIKEFCAENHEQVACALALGSQRIELCDNLAVGGTTPSYGVMEYVCQLAHQQEATVMTMIRPRGGNFHYSPEEVGMMLVDCRVARQVGSDGLVFGALTEENWLDEPVLKQLVEASDGGELVFHMAFDLIPRSRQKEAIDWLADHGFQRILTRGHISGSALEHWQWLKEIMNYARGKIEILVGGGLTKENLPQLMDLLEPDQVHGTRLFW